MVVLLVALLYDAGMTHLEGKPRGFWRSLEWAGETITTTGYGSDASWTHPLMVLFVVGVQFLGVILIYLMVPVFLLPFLEERFETRLPREAGKVSRHVVIYRNGPAVATLLTELRARDVPYLIVEDDSAEVRRLVERREPVLFRRLEEDALAHARLHAARALIANAGDAENAAVVLEAREHGFKGEVLALVEDPLHRHPMTLAGASGVFTPRHVLAAALADRASNRFSPVLSGLEVGDHIEVAEVRVVAASALAERSLRETRLGTTTGASVIGLWVGGRLDTRPTADTRIPARAIVVAVGSRDALARLAKVAGHGGAPYDRSGVVIAGFGVVGRKVRELLESAGETTRVIDKVAAPGVDLVGDALGPGVLASAGAASARAVVVALDNDVMTLFATMLLRDLSPEVPVIARVNDAANVQRIHAAGADFALSLSRVSGQILASRLLGSASVDIAPELRVVKVVSAGLEGKSAIDLDIRRRTSCSVVLVERGGQVVRDFDPALPFSPGDVVYICGSAEATRRFEDMFAGSHHL